MSNRPETGPMRFGDDWTGVFIRGDNAGYYAFILQGILERFESQLRPIDEASILKGLISDLSSSNDFNKGERNIQKMKEYKECLMGEEEGCG